MKKILDSTKQLAEKDRTKFHSYVLDLMDSKGDVAALADLVSLLSLYLSFEPAQEKRGFKQC